ncbi:MAG: polysulfide reductase NrfD [Chloroflexi bacterium]|nr:polysulfide reductase NrfD [Chloroflexota bacterium]MCL5075608.1 polysulfide reductase NrfD [Chloroflexota bacterium]
MKINTKILWGLSVVAFAVGSIGLFQRLTTGHLNTAYGSYVPWGLWVAMYLFFVGLAAGIFLIAALDIPLGIRIFAGVAPAALFAALVALGAGLLQIWLDLGWMSRIWNVYLSPSPSSVMAQIVWGYTLFGLLILVALVLRWRGGFDRWLKVLMWLGIPLALYLSGAVGALLGVEASRLFWHVGLFPAQFPVFSVASGAALMLVILELVDEQAVPRRDQLLGILALATIALQIVKLYFLWADYSQSLYGGVPENVAAVNMVLFGPYWWAFWILQIGLGTLIPLIILVVPRWGRQPALAGWAGMLILLGFAVARSNIVFPAMTVPEFDALRLAYTGPGLTYEYFPTLTEWLLAVWIVGLAALAFLAGHRWVLPKFKAV